MKNGLGCLVLILICFLGGLALPRISRFLETPEAKAQRVQADQENAARRELIAKDPKAGHESEICEGVQRQVKALLAAPATADFSSCTWHYSQVKYDGDGRYEFSSWVDAQNSFGAMIRTYYDGEALIDDQALRERTFKITRLATH